MKHFLLTLLFSVALLPMHAQESTTYGVVRLSHAEITDSLYKLNSAIKKVQNELDNHLNGSMKIKEGYYYSNGRDKTVDSLNHVKWDLISLRMKLIDTQRDQLGLDVHLMDAGKYIRKAHTLDFFTVAFGIAGGACLGTGFANDKTGLKVTGIVTGVAAVGCFIGAYTCHFQSGKKLRLAANSITYSF